MAKDVSHEDVFNAGSICSEKFTPSNTFNENSSKARDYIVIAPFPEPNQKNALAVSRKYNQMEENDNQQKEETKN